MERRAQTGKADRATVEGQPVRVKALWRARYAGTANRKQRRPWKGRVVSIHDAGGAAQHFAGCGLSSERFSARTNEIALSGDQADRPALVTRPTVLLVSWVLLGGWRWPTMRQERCLEVPSWSSSRSSRQDDARRLEACLRRPFEDQLDKRHVRG